MAWLLVSLVRAAAISITAGIGYWFAVSGYVTLSVIFFLFAPLFYIFSTNNPATLYRRLFSACVLGIFGMLAMSISGYIALNFGDAQTINHGNVRFEINPVDRWILFGLISLAAICGLMDWITNRREGASQQQHFEVMIEHINVTRVVGGGYYRATGRGTMENSGNLPIHITMVEFRRRWFYKPAAARLFYAEGSVNMPPRDGVFIVGSQSGQVTSFVIDCEFRDPLRDVLLSIPFIGWLDKVFNDKGALAVRADAERYRSVVAVRIASGP
jgi:hypothetical protein